MVPEFCYERFSSQFQIRETECTGSTRQMTKKMKTKFTTISLVAAALMCGAGAVVLRAGVTPEDVKDAMTADASRESEQPLLQNAKMRQDAYRPFDLGELKPEGWLRDWAQLAAKGMTKTIGEEYTEFVKGWASADEPGWWHYEQTAYYTDGFTRLAFLLDDTLLVERSRRVMEAVAARQKPNGYIHSNTPEYVEKWGTTEADSGLYWSEAIFCRAALAYYSATGDEKILDMVKRVYEKYPIFVYDDGGYPFNGGDLDRLRCLCGLENLFELSRITGDMSFADKALTVLNNFDGAFIENWARKKEFLRTAISHGVSFNEAAKLPAIGYIFNSDPEYLAASVNNYEFLQENSMLPSGVNSSNEHLHGIGAFEAAESCDVSDFMWSNIWLARACGDSRYGDRIERDAFNALPGALNYTFTQCVYTQAPNRIPGFHLRIRDDGSYFKCMHWPTCCPSNINRALPNFIMNMAMLNGRDELMWLTYGPAHLKTRDGRFDILCETAYPFRETLDFTLNAIPRNQVLRLRVPDWCSEPSVSVNGKAVKFIVEDGFVTLGGKSSSGKSSAVKLKSGDRIRLTFPMQPELVTGNEKFPYFEGKKAPSWGIMVDYNGGMRLDGFVDQGRCAWVTCGPLLFAMSMQKANRESYDINEEHWTEYRYALTPESLEGTSLSDLPMHSPFDWRWTNAPLVMNAKASLVDWNPDKGDPVMPLEAPAVLEKGIDIKLYPYGFLAYRLTMFPLVGE